MGEKILNIKSSGKREVIDLTGEVEAILSDSGVESGVCALWVRHTTAALTVGEVGEGTEEDLMEVLYGMIPKIRFRHAHDPAHAPAHMIGSILGPGLTLPVMGGRLGLGTWQRVLLVELDGPRQRMVSLQLIRSL